MTTEDRRSKRPEQSRPADLGSQLEAAGLLSVGLLHDFNNLLTVINGYNEMLLASNDIPEKARHLLSLASGAGQRASSLVRTLMTLSRTAQTELRPLDINDSVRELVALAQHLLPASVELSAKLAPDVHSVLADGRGMLQVLLNLVVNSRDAMPDGGKLEIETSNLAPDAPEPYLPKGNYVELKVRDTGTGMDEPTRRRVFEPFYTTKGPGAGTGLGLPMVQHIVKRAGGFLSIESAKGAGTTVRIYLPAIDDSGAEAVADTQHVPAPALETIMLVENDLDLRVLMREYLRSQGYAVIDVDSGSQAVEVATSLKDRIDLLITEETLPDGSGPKLAACLHETRAELPVIYCGAASTSRNDEMPAEAVRLVKPFAVSELGDKVRVILDRKKTARILFVDDEQDVRIFAAEALRQAGFDVLLASDGNQALGIVAKERIDLVITDLVMREREGLETMMSLRQSHPALPVIAISGAFGGHFLRSAKALGARATLAKPFSGEDLLNIVREVLGR